jgi:hypothetical protein
MVPVPAVQTNGDVANTFALFNLAYSNRRAVGEIDRAAAFQ